MILSLVSVSMCTNSQNTALKQDDSKEYKPYLLIGTAYAYPDEDELIQGRDIVVECNSGQAQLKSDDENDECSSRQIRQLTDMQTQGGVYSICHFFNGTLILFNSRTHLCQLSITSDVAAVKFVGGPSLLVVSHALVKE